MDYARFVKRPVIGSQKRNLPFPREGFRFNRPLSEPLLKIQPDLCAERFLQNVLHEQRGGGLSVGAGDAHKGDGELAAMMTRQLLQGRQHILYHNAALIDTIARVADDTQRRSLLQSLRSETVAVKCLTFECEKYTAGSNAAAVSSDLVALQILPIQLFNRFHKLTKCHKRLSFFTVALVLNIPKTKTQNKKPIY